MFTIRRNKFNLIRFIIFYLSFRSMYTAVKTNEKNILLLKTKCKEFKYLYILYYTFR